MKLKFSTCIDLFNFYSDIDNIDEAERYLNLSEQLTYKYISSLSLDVKKEMSKEIRDFKDQCLDYLECQEVEEEELYNLVLSNLTNFTHYKQAADLEIEFE